MKLVDHPHRTRSHRTPSVFGPAAAWLRVARLLTVLTVVSVTFAPLGMAPLGGRVLAAAMPDRSLTVTVANTFSSPLQWEGAPATGSNISYDEKTGAPCGKTSADYCDVTLLHVAVEPSFWGTQEGGIVVRIYPKPLGSLANFDLYVYRSDAYGNLGDSVTTSTAFSETGEAVTIAHASGYYLLHVIYTEVLVAAGYSGIATLVPPGESTLEERLAALSAAHDPDLSISCVTRPSLDGVWYTWCDGEVPSWDDLGLHTGLLFPADAAEPLPAVLMLHAWGGGRGEWTVVDTRDASDHPEVPNQYHWNNTWFTDRGFVSIAYTARGFGQSCGMLDQTPQGPKGPDGEDERYPCAWGYTHVADRDYETKDSQHMLSLLVDAGIADPDRLAATGASYGGGQTWLLATSLPWVTKAGRTLQLAAAIPQFGWTDLLNELAPNGRASDRRDQRASHELPPGILKQATWEGAYLVGRFPPFPALLVSPHGKGRYNTADAEDRASFMDGWNAFWNKGEPYDPAEAEALATAFRNKSAYYADDYFTAVRARTARAVPIFAIQGWTDAYLPAVETLQMYRKLKAAAPTYPIYMAFGDLGHDTAQNPRDAWIYINDQANEFLDAFLLADGRGAPTDTVFSFATQCPAPTPLPPPVAGHDWDPGKYTTQVLPGGTPLPPPVAGHDWDRLRGRAVRLTKTATDELITTSGPPNAVEEVPTDPSAAGATCITQRWVRHDPLDWAWEVGEGFTLLGLPTLKVGYALTGEDATIVAKLWDVDDASMTRTLVTRGMYRLSVAGGDARDGMLSFQLVGNHWTFLQGHSIHLELSQTDAPFLRPDNLPSSIRFSAPELVLPTVKSRADLRVTNIEASNSRGREGEKVTDHRHDRQRRSQ